MTLHTIDEPGRTITVDVGDRIELAVAENASTGYVWQVSASPDGLRLVDDEMRPPEDLAPGRSGRHVLHFNVDEPVDGAIRLELRRPWEASSPPEATFDVQLRTYQR